MISMMSIQDDHDHEHVASCSSSCSTQIMVAPTHDVFISFRGEDTRKGFTSHLYDALCRKGVKVFIDNMLRRGEEISCSLVKAIEESRLCIIVFSKHYATSTWCLDELVNIMYYKKSNGQMVRPIFVDVDPCEVRNQIREFGEALAIHEKNDRNGGKVQGWRAALKEAASLSGWHLRNQIESEFIQRIVEEVYNKLNRPVIHIAEHPVGLDSQVQAMNSLLNIGSNGKRMLAIYGVGGVGKTTIAKALYNMVADGFEGSCFLVSVGEMSKKHGISWLQETLLREIVGEKSLKIAYNYIGRDMIKAKLSHKKVLVVLDGVDHTDHLEELAGGKDWFGLGSRIIITTREALLLDRVDAVYQVKELKLVDALQLFCWKAFKKPHPPNDQYRLLSNQLVTLAKGIPLALIVLGSFLYNKTIKEWIDLREKLWDMPFESINLVVKMSFDGLEKNEESIFLDIACFFQGDDKDFIIKQFDRCNFHPERGIEKLIDMSLIYIEFNKVWMHEIIQQFGKDIVYQESPADPGRRSRLWYHNDILQVLQQDSVNYVTQAIKLDWPGAENELRRNNATEKFKCLRILMVRDAYFSGFPGYLCKDLKWLRRNDLSSPRAMDIHHNASFSGCSMHSDLPDTFEIRNHPGRFEEASNMECTVTASNDATRNPVQHLVGSLVGKRNLKKKIKRLPIVPQKAAKKLVQLVMSPLESFLNKRSFERVKQIRALLDNDTKLCREFDFSQICKATNNFDASNLIGEGGSSSVYLAKFDNREVIAVKRLKYFGKSGVTEMPNELQTQCRLHHKNILPLLGYSLSYEEVLLVMEYMGNFTLRDYLDGYGHSTYFLSWFRRIKVALDIARGLEYLHVFANPPIIYRDVKTSNILLDDDYSAKLTDFGLSVEAKEEVLQDVLPAGTMGYLCPEIFMMSHVINTKCDVFSFGVILLELLTGNKPLIMDDDGMGHNLVDRERNCKSQVDFLDKRMPLPEGLEMEATVLVRELARECLKKECRKRPSMTRVVRRLEGVLEKCQPGEADTESECNLLPDSRISSPCHSIISSHSTELDYTSYQRNF